MPDARLWDHEPLRLRRWRDMKIMHLPPESEFDRDAEWGRTHDWEWTYFPDGSKVARTRDGADVRFPGVAA